jgi:para-nitrobenzyl esterase
MSESVWFTRGARCIAAAGMIALRTATASADAGGPKTIVTDNGPVRGVVDDEARSFRGIPYAAPPVGDARWQPPSAAARWNGLRDATAFAPHCPQTASPFGLASQSEDCLYLNVYTPARDHGAKKAEHAAGAPVMVWLHPGAFMFGEGDDYDPRALVQNDVVVVTLNYRLGALGFLAHPALTAESGTSGNYGLQDQQAALRWVKRNIEAFGGDPGNVTIFGESAGAVSVHAHLASPQSAGLFHRAIAQSGGYSLTQPTLAAAESEGATFASAVGCSSQDSACLRAVPVASLLANQSSSPTAYLPKVDGSTLPVSIGTAFATGQFNRVPVIEGSTHDEFRLFVATSFVFKGIPVNATTYPSLIAAALSVPLSTAQAIATYYYPLAAYPSAAIALGAVGTDAAFACNARVAARLLAQYVPTWAYEFSDPAAPQVFLPPAGFPYGAYHGAELPYLFDVRESVMSPALTTAQEQLAQSMKLYWTQFARAANPNTAGATAWAAYAPTTSDAFLSFSGSTPAPYSGTAFGADHKCAVWGSP